MRGVIDSSYYDEIIQSLGVQNIFTSMGIKLIEAGNKYLFSSPFRPDKNPSCVYYKDSGVIVDFAGDFKGNLFSLYKEVNGESLFKAYDVDTSHLSDKIFERALTVDRIVKEVRRVKVNDKDLVRVTDGVLVPVCSSRLARAYCSKRKISQEAIDFFEIQFSTYSKINTTKYINRLVIPIYTEEGFLSSIEGRRVDETEDSKKVIYPFKASTSLLFNFGSLDLCKPVVIVEGIMDLIQVWQAGYKNVTTTFGIQLTTNQVAQLQRIPKLILFPDHDEGGHKFIENVEEKYPNDFEIAMLKEWGMDAGDASKSEIEYAIQTRISLTEYMIDRYELFEKSAMDTDFTNYLVL